MPVVWPSASQAGVACIFLSGISAILWAPYHVPGNFGLGGNTVAWISSAAIGLAFVAVLLAIVLVAYQFIWRRQASKRIVAAFVLGIAAYAFSYVSFGMLIDDWFTFVNAPAPED